MYLHFKCYLLYPFSQPPCFYEDAPTPTHSLSPTHSHLNTLAFPYTGEMSLLRNKSVSSYWCQTMTLSATYMAGAMSSLHVYSLVGCLVPWSSGGGVLVSWYCCPSYGLKTPSAPSVLSLTPPLGCPCSVDGELQASSSVSVRISQSLSGDIGLLSASTSWRQDLGKWMELENIILSEVTQ